MRRKLGKTFAVEAVAPAAPVVQGPPLLLDVEEVVKGVEGNVLTVTIPPTNPATHNKLTLLQVYLIPHDQPLETDPDALDAKKYPVEAVDVSDWHGTLGGDLPITLPAVDRAVPYVGQLVHTYET